MTPWPPNDPSSLTIWLAVDLPAMRDRRENLIERIEAGRAVIHQPINANLSQNVVQRTETSDPTFDVVALWGAEIPAMEAEVRRIDLILRQYNRVVGKLEETHRKVIQGTYDLGLSMSEICGSTGISERTYYNYRQHAIEFMARRF